MENKESRKLDKNKELKFIKKLEPNIFQKLLIKLGIIKDKRYKPNDYILDELGIWQDPNHNYIDSILEEVKKSCE